MLFHWLLLNIHSEIILVQALANQYIFLQRLPQSAEQMKKMVEKEAWHIDLIKRLQRELQEHITKSNFLSEELKQANQQLLEAGKQNSLLQVNYNKVVLEATEERKRVAALVAELGSLKDDLMQYKVGEEGRWEEKKKEFLKWAEFYDLLGVRSSFLFEYGYKGAVKQFKKARYLLKEHPLTF